ncbi:MAG: vWA domain-containing protein [Candidatus Binatus sp.]|uniref:vWA domain-containing protein n=1 Tax=Candidatus Binatus sp. TaxID=2811406 RepID=UPI003C76BB41
MADIINRLLQNLCLKCAKDDGIRHYYDVGVIGYGATVASSFGGALAGKDLVSITDVADSPARVLDRIKKVEDGAGGLVEQTVKLPVWFEPIANGGTPMCEALNRARSIISQWVTQHPSSFPPIVINITDGEATDGDPSAAASGLIGLSTSDGNVLLFNVHISGTNQSAIEFPDSEGELPDDYAKLLFRMSSELPEYMRNMAQQESLRVSERTRGFVFQADMTAVIRFLDIGTRPSNLR